VPDTSSWRVQALSRKEFGAADRVNCPAQNDTESVQQHQKDPYLFASGVYALRLDASKYRVFFFFFWPEGREAVLARDLWPTGDIDLGRAVRVPRRRASVLFAQAAVGRAASQTARFML